MHWASQLSSTQVGGREYEWVGADADRIRVAWGHGAVMWAAEVGEAAIAEASRKLPLLGGSVSIVDALFRATTSTTLRVLAIVSGSADSELSVVSAESVEATRDLARRGLKLGEFAQAIRFGHSILNAAFIDAISATSSPDSFVEIRRVTDILFGVIDDFIASLTAVFLDEQSAWGESTSAAQLELVKKIVGGAGTDIPDAERLLRYPLNGPHVAIIAWNLAPGERTAHRLRAAIDPVLQCWGQPRASLVIPVGSNTLWAWGTFAADGYRNPVGELPEFADANLVVGQAGMGLDGFRRTHLEARSVERLIRQGSGRHTTTVPHHDVDLDALLLSDRAGAAQFVTRYLGPLGADDPRMKELRSTLRCYLDLDRSLAKTAALEHISRNAVTYRVQQAFALCAHASDTPVIKLRAALAIVDWLLDTGGAKPAGS
ncbi:helix-turn-helix domain-containing protein [Rhodococcus sp. IEGM 1354]|uniref:PucR family transcriptional regulator n=1 Tax=Rhodococcus sp. IEGM 1354 TaxID=3047088 RepID=UPI0024B757C2|nr:helix-turn-helix domain-containing protein [Rhodococcus sp. IEGM 1354]MDI9933221.1 helix-turn-helix domain-containing protein [Rhodococcus sp. IEGM 1354]